jgi:quercetin dioxygenase-like cupin family protein
MSRKWMLVGAALVAAVSGAVVSATPGLGVTFAPLTRATYEPFDINFKSDEFVDNPPFKVKFWSGQEVDIATQIVTFQPGGYSGWHSHAGPVIIAVKTGTLTEYDGNDPTCAPHTLPQGSGKIEVEDPSHVHMVRNETSEVAELVVTYFMPVGVNPPRRDRPSPGNCPF